MPELKLKKEVFGWRIAAARSGHGHFADYHERFGHDEADYWCKCGKRRSQLPPFSCSISRPHRAKLFSKAEKRQLNPEEILGTPEGIRIFCRMGTRNGAILVEIGETPKWLGFRKVLILFSRQAELTLGFFFLFFFFNLKKGGDPKLDQHAKHYVTTCIIDGTRSWLCPVYRLASPIIMRCMIPRGPPVLILLLASSFESHG